MAQLSIHDAVLAEGNLNVKATCDTLVRLLNSVEKNDMKACTRAAEGALCALCKMSGREGFDTLTTAYMRQNVKAVLTAAFELVKKHEGAIINELAQFQGFAASDILRGSDYY